MHVPFPSGPSARGFAPGLRSRLLRALPFAFALTGLTSCANILQNEASGCTNSAYPENAPINAFLEGNVSPAVDALLAQQLTASNVFFGDSLIEQWPGPALGGSFTFNDPAAAALTINAGVLGSTLCNLTRRIHRHVTPFQPESIVTAAGGNDLLIEVPAETVRVNLQDYFLLLRAQNPNSRVIYLEIPPSRLPRVGFEVQRASVNEYARWLASELDNFCYVRTGDLLGENQLGFVEGPLDPDKTTDGIHWKPEAYLPVEARVLRAMEGAPQNPAEEGVFCTPQR